MGAGLRLQRRLGRFRHARGNLPPHRGACRQCPRPVHRRRGHADPGGELRLSDEPLSGQRRHLQLYEDSFRLRSRLSERLVSDFDLCGNHLGQRDRPAADRTDGAGRDFPVRLRLRDRRIPRVVRRNPAGSRIAGPCSADLSLPETGRALADRDGGGPAGRRGHLLYRSHAEGRRQPGISAALCSRCR